jgi:hypothetical protein
MLYTDATELSSNLDKTKQRNLKMTDTKKDQTPVADPSAFFDAVTSFTARVADAMVAAAGDDPDTAVMKANGDLVTSHFKKMFEEANARFQSSSVKTKQEIGEIIRVTDGINLASVGEKAAISSLRIGKLGKGFFAWISKHLAELKKIIRLIVGTIFGSVPKWLNTLLDLIDQLWDLIVSLLSSIFGFDITQISKMLSAGKVNYLNEITAVAKLDAVMLSKGNDEDE